MEEALIGRLEAAVSRLEAVNAGQHHPSITPRDLVDDASARDPAILAFDELVAGALGRVSMAAGKIGADVAEVTGLVEKAFLIAKDLLVRTKQTEVLVEYKNKDPDHVEWAKALKELYVPSLRDYVKNFYPLGPVWKPLGSATNKAPSAPSPPAASLTISSTSSSQPKSGMSAVFAEISSGGTQGLRKVTDDMKSKNRTDRTGVVVAEGTHKAPSFSSTKAPAKLELQMGRKWVVEHHVGNKCLVIEDCDSKQSVYVYGCKDSVLQVKGKVNNITIDKCTKTGLLFKGVVAACEIVNCNSVEIQCEGSVPTISIDNTSGCQLYLGNESLEASITTAKSSEINALIPDAKSDGDWVEHSLPQQYIHEFKDGQFTTSPVSHSGA
ncbi:hypothetical protein QOZ80_8BG0661630 [Eleusine coracana subsp. coracana]|nr:hypothetical protein QOZ80_8BG0661630 [Eleusine coracana subsp. coracana]